MGWKPDPELVKKLSNQQPNVIYDEEKVPLYILPNLLTCLDGTEVKTLDIWINKRRPEILELFRKFMYGRAPLEKLENLRFEIIDYDKKALEGLAIRKIVRIFFKEDVYIDVLIYLPIKFSSPIPIFLILNFEGNHAVINDKGIPLNPIWNVKERIKIIPKEENRGEKSSRYPIQLIIKRGYGFATCNYNDIVPDFPDC
ncbi:MAG: acetylxylan esterase, partial [bacterium]|nr:acetylxylan esterase [bacterium]MDW8163315.1 acetylxylan esterase [Candidatus Omnitrophota bacterium]